MCINVAYSNQYETIDHVEIINQYAFKSGLLVQFA
jgi:hypothetical protein